MIAISIAAQTIPKVAELYMQDWLSLGYIWFLILASTHAVVIKVWRESGMERPSSSILNLYLFLPLAIALSLPYVFYVLRLIQPGTVIQRIVKTHLQAIHRLARPTQPDLLSLTSYREAYQQVLLESFNQLGNLLEYVAFKEPKAQIIQSISHLLRAYVQVKPQIPDAFFRLGPCVYTDISFKTMVDQFHRMEQSRTFYEQKGFRLLGNAYIQLLDSADFDLASLCASEMTKVGRTAFAAQDEPLLDVIVVQLNTMLRFALKHGIKHNEARHLYNLAFHYRKLIEQCIEHDQKQRVQQTVYYLRTYSNEAYAHGQTSSAMYFIVDVFAAEIKTILMDVYQRNWPLEMQQQLLSEFLQVDRPPEPDPTSPEPRRLNSGVRTLQIDLALFYLSVDLPGLTERIITDLLDDARFLGEPTFRQTLTQICDRLRSQQPTFWEDTDRGTVNLYYTAHPEQIPQFYERVNRALERFH